MEDIPHSQVVPINNLKSAVKTRKRGSGVERRPSQFRTWREGYHHAKFGIDEWRIWCESAEALGLSVSELTRLIGRQLPKLIPHLELVPPEKKELKKP